jgi:hypothetical protein
MTKEQMAAYIEILESELEKEKKTVDFYAFGVKPCIVDYYGYGGSHHEPGTLAIDHNDFIVSFQNRYVTGGVALERTRNRVDLKGVKDARESNNVRADVLLRSRPGHVDNTAGDSV